MMMDKIDVHPIVFLEPAVHLILGSILLAWSPFPSVPVGVSVGSALVGLGFIWGALAVRRYRAGAFRLHKDELVANPGFSRGNRGRIERADVTNITTRRGSRRLGLDPVHALLTPLVHYGSVEVHLRDGGRCVVQPVNPERAASVVTNWSRGVAPPATRPQNVALLPGLAAFLFASFAVSVLAGTGATHARGLPVLLAGATVLELSFWLFLWEAHKVHRGERFGRPPPSALLRSGVFSKYLKGTEARSPADGDP